MRLLLRLALDGFVERVESSGPAVLIGSSDRAELQLAHESIAPTHARLLAKGGRVILVVFGRGRTKRRGERIWAPALLDPGEPFGLGNLELRVWPLDETWPRVIGRRFAGRVVERELEPIEPGERRFALEGAELVIRGSTLTCAETCAGSSSVLTVDHLEDRSYYIETVEPGVRLADVLARKSVGAVTIPAQAGLVIAAELARAVAAHHDVAGPHGALEPRMIQLGRTGSVTLLRSSPAPGDLDDERRRPYLSLRRRCGLGLELADDLEALAQLMRDIDIEPLDPSASAAAIAAELADRAAHARSDPTRTHVARLVHLVEDRRARTLVARPLPQPVAL